MKISRLFPLLLALLSLAPAQDYRISDNDGQVLNINADGSIPVTGGGTGDITSVGSCLTGDCAMGTMTMGSGSGFTWTFDAGATDPAIVFGSGAISWNSVTSWTIGSDMNVTLSGGANGISFDTTTLSVDAADDCVGIGSTGCGGVADLYVLDLDAGENGTVRFEENATSEFYFNIVSQRTSGDLGRMRFWGDNSAAVETEFAGVRGTIRTGTSGAEDGELSFDVFINGARVELLAIGEAADSNIAIKADTTTTTGTITSSRTDDLGWIVQNATNQACNTTCTTGACVIGIDTVTTSFLSCTTTTADSCLCAG